MENFRSFVFSNFILFCCCTSCFVFAFSCGATEYGQPRPAAEVESVDENNLHPARKPKKLVHIRRNFISGPEKAINFSAVYLTQWSFYLISQRETIEHHGSLDNWTKNIFKTRFDRDYLDYNVIKHTLAGSSYYLFYRSRGYSEIGAFTWAFVSSFAFEFSIETYTEPPSIQDIYLTPVYGTIVGMGAERLSLYLHSLQTWPARGLGYILNPFTLLPFSSYEWSATPTFSRHTTGVVLKVGF